MFSQVSVNRGGSLYDVTACLAAWSHVPSGGSLSMDVSAWGVSVQGVSVWGVSVQGGGSVWGVSVWGVTVPIKTPQTETPRQKPPTLAETPLYCEERAVRILLECFLVSQC